MVKDLKRRKNQTLIAGMLLSISAVTYSCTKDSISATNPLTSSSAPSSNNGSAAPLQRILFVGDSFTHGRYAPVRTYNSGGKNGNTTGSPLVFDENYGQTGARAELENGPWGGIPGIFAELAYESGLNYDVHIEAISATSLEKNFDAASGVIAQSKWNAVVLQELSLKALPSELTGSSLSNPNGFYSSVQTIEKAVHTAAPSSKVYLYEAWPRADLAETLSGNINSSKFNKNYAANLSALATANNSAYHTAAQQDGNIAGIAPAGDAWVNAWAANIANSNPFTGTANTPVLWYGLNQVNDPQISNPDYLHPSIYGAYLNGLVLFQQITGTDVRTFGQQEKAAAALGISGTIAVQLQQIAWQTVTQENSQQTNQTVAPVS